MMPNILTIYQRYTILEINIANLCTYFGDERLIHVQNNYQVQGRANASSKYVSWLKSIRNNTHSSKYAQGRNVYVVWWQSFCPDNADDQWRSGCCISLKLQENRHAYVQIAYIIGVLWSWPCCQHPLTDDCLEYCLVLTHSLTRSIARSPAHSRLFTYALTVYLLSYSYSHSLIYSEHTDSLSKQV